MEYDSRIHNSKSWTPLLRSKGETAVLLGISERLLDDLIASGAIPVRRIGRRVLVHTAVIEDFARQFEGSRELRV